MRGMPTGAAMHPGPNGPWLSVGSTFLRNDLYLDSDATFVTPDGTVRQWNDAFVGPIGEDFLSKTEGGDGHLQHPDRSVTWIRRRDGGWEVVLCEPISLPVQTPEEPSEPEPYSTMGTIVYNYVGQEMEVPTLGLVGHANGALEMRGRIFRPNTPIDCEFCGFHIKRAEGSNVICFSNEGLRAVYKHEAPGIFRRLMLAYPKGWFQIKTSHGIGNTGSFNTWSERAVWSIWLKVFLIYVIVSFIPIVAFVGPVLLYLIYASGRLNLPRSFFRDNVATYYPEFYNPEKAVEAEHLGFGGLLEMYSQKPSQ